MGQQYEFVWVFAAVNLCLEDGIFQPLEEEDKIEMGTTAVSVLPLMADEAVSAQCHVQRDSRSDDGHDDHHARDFFSFNRFLRDNSWC